MTETAPHRCRARVVGLEDATHDVRIVRLEIAQGSALPFRAGQYAQVSFGDYPARDYSMASRPGETILEFHIRDMKTHGASGFVAGALALGDIVTLEGPLGRVYLRDDDPGPILAVAGGSGLAPMASIVGTALAKGLRQPVHLYFGARDERDIYLEERFADLMATHPNFRFVPVVECPQAATSRRIGRVTGALTEDSALFEGALAYLAGPPPMIEAAAALLAELGLPEDRILADPFFSEEENAARAAAAAKP